MEISQKGLQKTLRRVAYSGKSERSNRQKMGPVQGSASLMGNGYVQGVVPENLIRDFVCGINSAKTIPFTAEDFDLNYSAGIINWEFEEKLNEDHRFYMLEQPQLAAVHSILLSLKDSISDCLGSPWSVVNISVYEILEKKESSVFAWKTDICPPSACKIRIYPEGADYEKGTVELNTPTGSSIFIAEANSWFLFKASETKYREHAPKSTKQLVIEISILPTTEYALSPVCAGLNAGYPRISDHPIQAFSYPSPSIQNIEGINVGGGPNWQAPGWINLEEVVSPLNPTPFHLYPNCRFPLEDLQVKHVYTSHAIEHLTIPTVYRVLSESYRVLQENGDLVIKIPDYDKVLECWRMGERSFFYNHWGIESVTPGWRKKGVCDCLDHRAAMIFCSFFNSDNPFGMAKSKEMKHASRSNQNKYLGSILQSFKKQTIRILPRFIQQALNPPAYFGPPTLDVQTLRNFILPSNNFSPSMIAKEFRKQIKRREENFHFCHQSAWSRQELEALLNDFRFEVISFDSKEIIDNFRNIPDIQSMTDISIFCWAKKRN